MILALEEISPTKRRFKIEIPKEVVEKEISDAYSRLNRKVKVHGFRPGRIPRPILERLYGKTVEAEVVEKLIPDYYFKTVKETGLSPVENPTFEGDIEMKKGAPLTFIATVEIKPVFEVADYEGIGLEKPRVEVAEEEIERTLRNLQESHAYLEAFEEPHPLEKGDFCLIGLEADSSIEKGKATDILIEIGSGSLLPGFDEQLIGHKKGDRVDVTLRYPQDHRKKDLAREEAFFKVDLKEIKKKVLPELDDDFAKDLGYNSLSDLREAVKDDLEKEKKRIAERKQKELILKRLIEIHSFDIPTSMVERELAFMVLRRQREILQQGGSLEGLDEERLKTELRPIAFERIKAVLILEAIGRKEGISVSDGDLNNRIEEMASRLNQRPEDIKRFVISQEGSLDGLRNDILNEKILDFLLLKAVFK